MPDPKKAKVLFVDNGLFLPFAFRLAHFFSEVHYWTPHTENFPTPNRALIGDGYDEIHHVDDLFYWLPQVDLVVIADTGFGGLLSFIRHDLKKRVWGAGAAENFELYRDLTKTILQTYNLPVIPYEVVRGIKALREHLRGVEDKWIKISRWRGVMESWHHVNYKLSEPRLDELEYKLGAIKGHIPFLVEDALEAIVEVGQDGYSIDGEYPSPAILGYEVKDEFYLASAMPYSMLPRSMREINEKLSPYFRRNEFRGFYSNEVRIGKDKTAYLTDPCCFSVDTEILTDVGWKLFQELDGTESVATLDINTKEIVYQRPTHYQKYRYDGNMMLFTNRDATVELLVTPDHGFWTTRRSPLNPLKYYKAMNLKGQHFVPRTGVWNGKEEDVFELPAYDNAWEMFCGKDQLSHVKRTKHDDPLEIPMDDWLAFLGIYLAEGSHDKWNVNVTQHKFVEEVATILEALPFYWNYGKGQFRASSVQLRNYLKQFGTCADKYVPEFVKWLSPRQIRIFLEAFWLGDGAVSKPEQRIYYTTSEQLANDLQELIFKAGSVASISRRPSKGTEMQVGDGVIYVRQHDALIISERLKFRSYYFEASSPRRDLYIKNVEYHGDVYDVTVPNGTLYVRREGKPLWSSNCRAASPASEVYQEMYGNWDEILWEGAVGEMVKPRLVAPYGVQAMIFADWAEDNWQAIYYPDEIKEWVKLYNSVKIKGTEYIVPQTSGLYEIGSVVAVGNTIEEALRKLKGYAAQIEGYSVRVRLEALPEALKVVHEGLKHGIPFGSGDVPDASEVKL